MVVFNGICLVYVYTLCVPLTADVNINLLYNFSKMLHVYRDI